LTQNDSKKPDLPENIRKKLQVCKRFLVTNICSFW
jgi:hypothetical protein